MCTSGLAVSSCIYISEVSRNIVLWQSVFGNVDFALMFWATTSATSIYLTVGIAVKIASMRRRLRGTPLVRGCYASHLSATAAVVESALLGTIFQICMLAAYARNSAINLVFLGATAQITVRPSIML